MQRGHMNVKYIKQFSSNQSWHPSRCESAGRPARPTRHLQSNEQIIKKKSIRHW
jgi:hypothetical protein